MELPRSEMALSDSVGSRRTSPDWEEGFEPGARDDFEAEASQVGDGDEDEVSQEEPILGHKAKKTAAVLTSGLVTGADLLAKHEKPRISPNVFRHGMAVEHPQYGAGTIIALSGDGPKRTATVRFFQDNEERKFRLIFSDLTPAEA
jgi:DNA helicase-2/ATP-dependent DNA helicase PcrA